MLREAWRHYKSQLYTPKKHTPLDRHPEPSLRTPKEENLAECNHNSLHQRYQKKICIAHCPLS